MEKNPHVGQILIGPYYKLSVDHDILNLGSRQYEIKPKENKFPKLM